jgi:WD40 repeat protein
VVIRDAATGQRLQTLTGHRHWVTDLSYSHDGSLLLSTGKDGAIMLWNAESGALLQTFAGHTQWVNDADFSPDGAMVISGSDDRTLRIWDVATGRTILLLDFPNEITIAGFSPDGKQFIFNDGFEVNFYPVDFTILNQNLTELLAKATAWAGRPGSAAQTTAN